MSLFDRLSQEARQVMGMAQDEARALRHNYLGTEHLLLGLIAVKAPGLDGLLATKARAVVVAVVGHGKEQRTEPLPRTPRLQEVFRQAQLAATSEQAEEVECRHLLAGLLAEGEGVGMRVLLDLGVDVRELQRISRSLMPVTERLKATGVRIMLASEVAAFDQPQSIEQTPEERADRQAEERGEVVLVVAGAFADLAAGDREYRLWGSFMGTRAVPLNEDPTSALISIAEEHRDDLRWNLQHDLRYGGDMDLTRWEFYAAPFGVELSRGLRERLSPAWAERPPKRLPGEREDAP